MFVENENVAVGSQDQYKILRQLGEGKQAKVHLAVDTKTGKKVALKEFTLEYPELVEKELDVVQKLEHPNLIKYLGHGEMESEEGNTVKYLATEYASKGTLFDMVCHSGGFDEDLARFYTRQLVHGVKHLYSKGFVHRDIKLENLLLDADFNIKIIDFGFCGNTETNQSGIFETKLGTQGYMAPELLMGKKYSGEKADTFAIGVALFTMVFQRPPFQHARLNDKFYKLFFSKKQDIFWKVHCQGNDDLVSSEFKDLINSLLCHNYTRRITLDKLSQHPWMTEGEVPSTVDLVNEMEQRYETACLESQEEI